MQGLGTNSFWGWVVGSEIIVGGTIGAGAAVAGAAVATGGVALGAAAWIGAGGAVAGSSALVSVRNTIRVIRESGQPVAAPAAPERPAAPSKSEPLKPEKDKVYITMSKDGKIQATRPDGSTVLTGNFDNKSGNAKASVTETVAKK